MAEKKTILVVDDEPSVCDGVKLVLTDAGYEVEAASSGEEAVTRVAEKDYDVILMDLIMPQMDGAEACEKIKEAKPHARIVAISASPSAQRLNRFLSAGGIEIYLYKPFGKDELIEGVEKVMRGDYLKFRDDA